MQKGLHGGWYSIDLFSVPTSGRGIRFVRTPAFWHELESPCLYLIAATLCFLNFFALLITDNTSLKSRAQWLVSMKFVVRTSGTLYRTICYGVVPR